ncbi:MAG: hypothetical protein M0Z76_02335 [Gammaproteobacteria bacterium]|nr:hypothetical protein [Gammaproteobacteria bacterium]
MAKKGWQQAGLGTVVCVTALCYAPVALALGLGPLTVESNLGQPLQAHVRLMGFHKSDRRSVTAQLASSAAFAQLGLHKDRALKSVICRIHRQADGRYAVVLESHDVINAPFLQFVLQIKGPEGTLLREYTALLNPVSGVQPVSMSSTLRAPVPARQILASTPLSVPKVSAPVAPVAGLVRVRAGETAWVIAARHTPAGALVPQTLEAFLRRNPTAFIHHNINELRAGALLHVPTRQAVDAIPAAKAKSWLTAQDQAWGQYRQSLASQPAAAGSGNGTIGGALRAAQILPTSHNLLKIESAPLPGATTGTAGAAGRNGKGQKLAARMAQLRKELVATKHLIALDNQELAALEQQARARLKKPQKNTVSGVMTHPATAVKPVAGTPVAPHPVKPVIHRVVHPVIHRPAVVPPMPMPAGNRSFLATLWQEDRYPLLLVLAAVVAVGGLFSYRRRRSMNEFEESILSGGGLHTEGQMPDTASLAKTPEVSFLSEFSQGGTGNMQTDEVDPIAEADVYLAYGRDEQAEEILKDAIAKDGGRLELKAKLLEIYLQRHDLKTFEVFAEELYVATGGSGALWQRVEEMGHRLDPMNPLFKSGGRTSAAPAKGAKNTAADRIDFAAVARQLEAISSPAGADAGRAQAETLAPEPLGAQGAPGRPVIEDADNLLDFSGGLGEAEFPYKRATEAPPAQDGAATGLSTIDFTPGGSLGGAAMADASPKGGGAHGDLGGSSGDAGLDSGDAGLDFSWDATMAAQDAGEGKQDFALQFDEPAAASLPEIDFGDLGGGPAGDLASDDAPVLDLSMSDGDGGQVGDLVMEAGTAVGTGISADAVDTKLDLANAYIEMGDAEGARAILDEIMAEGNDRQRKEAKALSARSAAH